MTTPNTLTGADLDALERITGEAAITLCCSPSCYWHSRRHEMRAHLADCMPELIRLARIGLANESLAHAPFVRVKKEVPDDRE